MKITNNQLNILFKKVLGIIFMVFIIFAPIVYGADLTSTSFIVKDPIVGSGGGFGSSASFSSFFSGDITMIGSGSSSSFEGRYGFLWFPYVVKGIFGAVANGSDADLSWSASTAGLGWNISGYKTGISSVSGGPYTYTAHGLVTSYSYIDLSPGDYCFILQTLDGLGNTIATSQEECVNIANILSFDISNNTIGFGSLSSTATRYATSDTLGDISESAFAHTIIAATNATNGYIISVKGTTLASGANTIDAIAGGPTALSAGSEQFGIRTTASGGSGTVASPYNGSSGNYGFSTTPTVQTTFASAAGYSANTTYNVNYAANIAGSTEAGSYASTLTYIITGAF